MCVFGTLTVFHLIFFRLIFAGVNGYSSDQNEAYLPSKRYSRIVTPDFPERFAVISRLKKEQFTVGPPGHVMKSSVLPQVQVSVPEGAVSRDTQITMQVGVLALVSSLLNTAFLELGGINSRANFFLGGGGLG